MPSQDTAPRPAGANARPAWDLPKATTLLWTVLVVLAVGRAALYASPKHQGCYPVFAGGARHWLAGEDLYDSIHSNSLDVFRYGPVVALLLAPLAWLSDPWGSAVLRAANLAIFLPGLWWWCRAALPAGLSPNVRASLFLVVASLCPASLMDVQLNILTTGLLLVTMAAVQEERWSLAALACSLAVCLKAYPVALALVLALLYPRRFAGRLLVALAVLLTLPFLLQTPDYVLRQYHQWLHYGLNARYTENHFHDVMLFCQTWSLPLTRPTYQLIEVFAGLGVALVCLIRRCQRLPGQALCNLTFGLCCGWMMAFGPATEATTYILLAPAVAAATVMAWSLPNPRWYRLVITVACLLMSLSQLQLLFPLDKPLHRMAALPLAAVLFLLAVARRGLGDAPQAVQAYLEKSACSHSGIISSVKLGLDRKLASSTRASHRPQEA